DLLAVDRTDRGDFGGGAAHEHLVGEVEVFARQVALDHLDAVLARQRDQRVAGDAGEDGRAGRRGVQYAVEHQEDVLARTFAEQAGGGQRDALAEAEAARLARDQLAGQVVAAGLGAGRDGVRREALPARHAGGDAVFQRLWPEVGAHRPRGHGHVDRRFGGQAETAQAAPRDGAQVGSGETVLADDLAAGRGEFVARAWQCHVVDLRRVEQAVEVVGEAKDRCTVRRGVAADAFEYRGAVVQRMRHHVGGGLGPRLDLAVLPDPFGVLLRHGESPLGTAHDKPAPRAPGFAAQQARPSAAVAQPQAAGLAGDRETRAAFAVVATGAKLQFVGGRRRGRRGRRQVAAGGRGIVTRVVAEV